MGCKSGETLCEEKVEMFSTDYIEGVLNQESHKYAALFGVDIVPTNISSRIADNEIELCKSKTTIQFPTKAKNNDEQWRVVIQTPMYTQGIFIETCVK